jgi:hypothetical protein
MRGRKIQLSLIAMPSASAVVSGDPAEANVFGFFSSTKNFQQRMANLIRQALDEVLDGERTGRWCIDQLEKTEKTYIGTKMEIMVRNEFELSKGKLDVSVCGHDVDIKYSLKKRWMIAKENVGQLCLLLAANEQRARFSVGVVRATADILGAENQDKKRPILARNRHRILWLVNDQPYPANFILHLPATIRQRILAHKDGQPRVNELFRLVKEQTIPRSVLCFLGQQKDPMRRLRQAKVTLAAEGIRVICGHYLDERKKAEKQGFAIGKDESISFDIH